MPEELIEEVVAADNGDGGDLETLPDVYFVDGGDDEDAVVVPKKTPDERTGQMVSN